MQEYIMSRRILYFGRHAAYLECQSKAWWEHGYYWGTTGYESSEQKKKFAEGMSASASWIRSLHKSSKEGTPQPPTGSSRMTRFLDPQGSTGRMLAKAESSFFEKTRIDRDGLAEFSSVASSVMQDYTRRNLSKSADKLRAFEGLAQVIAEATDQEYHAGIFTRNLAKNLYWRPATGRLVSPEIKHRAPSWSWASWDGEIRFWNPDAEEARLSLLFTRTGSLASLKSAVFKELAIPSGSARGTSKVMLQLTAQTLPVVRLNSTLATMEKRDQWLNRDLEILPEFWPFSYDRWPTDKAYFISKRRSRPNWRLRSPRNSAVECPVGGEEFKTTSDGQILEHIEKCGAERTDIKYTEDQDAVIGVSLFDDPDRVPSSSLEAVLLWHSLLDFHKAPQNSGDETGEDTEDESGSEPEDGTSTASDEAFPTSKSADIHAQYRTLDQSLWRRGFPQSMQQNMRTPRVYFLLLVEPN